MSTYSLWRRACAELVGTALLIFLGVGSAAVGARLGFVALTFAFAVIACVYVLGPISGSHINPAVTVAFAATRRLPWRDVPAYVAAQLCGATVGALLIWGALPSRNGFGLASFDESRVSWGSALLAEAVGVGILVFVVLGAIDRTALQAVAGIVIGLALAAIILVIAPVTAAATNPARVFGPLLLQTVVGRGTHNWLQFLGAYVPAELAGGVLAALGYDALRGRARTARPAPPATAEPQAQRERARAAQDGAGRSRLTPLGR